MSVHPPSPNPTVKVSRACKLFRTLFYYCMESILILNFILFFLSSLLNCETTTVNQTNFCQMFQSKLSSIPCGSCKPLVSFFRLSHTDPKSVSYVLFLPVLFYSGIIHWPRPTQPPATYIPLFPPPTSTYTVIFVCGKSRSDRKTRTHLCS